jgi:hypothetical protein
MRQRFKTLKTLRVTLASGEAAVTGRRAHVSTEDGLCYADPDTHTDLLPIGRFMESFTGDGRRTTVVNLFEEIVAHGWQNDAAPNAVQAADLFQDVYLVDGTTVSTSDGEGTRSSGGRAILLEDGLVYVRAPWV